MNALTRLELPGSVAVRATIRRTAARSVRARVAARQMVERDVDDDRGRFGESGP
jgi:hypothetical protein